MIVSKLTCSTRESSINVGGPAMVRVEKTIEFETN